MLTLDDFDFELPSELIAQYPAAERAGGRLLDAAAQEDIIERKVSDFPALIQRGDLLVFNDTRVIKARLFGKKTTGGQVEVLIERIAAPRRVIAQIRANRPPGAGTRLVLENAFAVSVAGRAEDSTGFFALDLEGEGEGDFFALLEKYGRLPLPPYITHPAEKEDEARYQTVYARHPGAVAAPTAGLHFDETLLASLKARGAEIAWLTLHVGAGTFQPLRTHLIAEHRMHPERFHIPQDTADAVERARKRGGRVIAVGTTSLRALEAAGQSGRVQPGESETRLFITPGYAFRIVDCLFTNFHLPGSTLILLVHAFAGSGRIREAYARAIASRYRFFSYGDAMFLKRRDHAF
ncbi:MAG: tRNA preQ1(34) S-adenosylmethionine ribosyltransferase-isomerase QueA [Candidatus Accumulibacter sp.]|jgi:S-adenosylmethionine:tRNA ribosyltransferase-isomerase|nr:tRNA preQ1(34) S-adenosylmethionine ribosyltransferase-isomerase QueA [Accumulibacter sp.]